MEPNDIRHRIAILENFIKNAQKEMEHLQSECKHPNVEVKLIGYGGSSELRKVCTTCGKKVGYPNNKEIEEWNSNSNSLGSGNK